jgi:hypothetical protein
LKKSGRKISGIVRMEIKIPYNTLIFQSEFKLFISEDSGIDTQIIFILED